MSLGTVDDAEFQAWANRVRGKVDSDIVKKEIGKSAVNIGEKGQDLLVNATPSDSGLLRRSWRIEGPHLEGNGWVIKFSNNTEYASYVERGHRKRGGHGWVHGQFFMKRSLNEVQSQLPELITPGLWAFRDLLS